MLGMTLHPKTIILRSQSYIVHSPEDVWSKDNGERDWGHLVLTCEGEGEKKKGVRERERERGREGDEVRYTAHNNINLQARFNKCIPQPTRVGTDVSEI